MPSPSVRLPPFRGHATRSGCSSRRVFAEDCRFTVQEIRSGARRGGEGAMVRAYRRLHARLECQSMHRARCAGATNGPGPRQERPCKGEGRGGYVASCKTSGKNLWSTPNVSQLQTRCKRKPGSRRNAAGNSFNERSYSECTMYQAWDNDPRE